MKAIKTVLLGGLLLSAQQALALDFGSMLNSVSGSDVQSALSIGKKVVESNRDISEPEEIDIGKGIAANILGAMPLVPDPALQKYVNRVGLWLALQTERPNLPWKFGVIQSDDVDAFSVPGGTIFITKGLFMKLHSEAELAGVLGHEISHVLRKHQLKAIQKAMGNEWRNELAQTAAAHENNALAANAASKAFSAGTELYARGLDKDDEFEADRMGVVIAARGGYDPYGLPNVLMTLAAINPQDGAVALMFKTHPAPGKRLDILSSAMGTNLDSYTTLVEDTPRFDALKK